MSSSQDRYVLWPGQICLLARTDMSSRQICLLARTDMSSSQDMNFSDGNFGQKILLKKFFQRRKMKCRGSSETRFPKFEAKRSHPRGVNGRSKFRKKIEIRENVRRFKVDKVASWNKGRPSIYVITVERSCLLSRCMKW